jgi:hypothetical protein
MQVNPRGREGFLRQKEARHLEGAGKEISGTRQRGAVRADDAAPSKVVPLKEKPATV